MKNKIFLIYILQIFVMYNAVAGTQTITPSANAYLYKLTGTNPYTYGSTGGAIVAFLNNADYYITTHTFSIPGSISTPIQSAVVNMSFSNGNQAAAVISLKAKSSSCPSIYGVQTQFNCADNNSTAIHNFTVNGQSSYSGTFALPLSYIANGEFQISFVGGNSGAAVTGISIVLTYADAPLANNSISKASSSSINIQGSPPTGATGSYSYQWQTSTNSSTWTNISGANQIHHTSATVPPGLTYYRRVVTSGGQTIISNVVSYDNSPVSGNYICSDQSFCGSGNPDPIVQCNYATLSGGAPYSYQWQKLNKITLVYDNISGATGSSYDPPYIDGVTTYRRIVNPGQPNQSVSGIVKVEGFPNNAYYTGHYAPIEPLVLQANQNLVAENIILQPEEWNGANMMVIAPNIKIMGNSRIIYDVWVTAKPCVNGLINFRKENKDEFSEVFTVVAEENQTKVFPNPISSGTLNFGRNAGKYSLMDNTGKIVIQGTNADKLDINGYSKGIYMLTLDDKKEKIIIE